MRHFLKGTQLDSNTRNTSSDFDLFFEAWGGDSLPNHTIPGGCAPQTPLVLGIPVVGSPMGCPSLGIPKTRGSGGRSTPENRGGCRGRQPPAPHSLTKFKIAARAQPRNVRIRLSDRTSDRPYCKTRRPASGQQQKKK